MASLRVGTWNVAGARREGTNQVELDAVVTGVAMLEARAASAGDGDELPAAVAAAARDPGTV